MRLTTLSCAILCIFHTPVSIVQAYCWEPGESPYFTGPPVVEQVDLQTVRVSWFGLVEMRECTDQFLVKYWPTNDPQGYNLTKLVDQQVNSIDINVSPRVEYQFQAIAREDKGSISIRNKSGITDFKTSDFENVATTETAEIETTTTTTTTIRTPRLEISFLTCPAENEVQEVVNDENVESNGTDINPEGCIGSVRTYLQDFVENFVEQKLCQVC